ncbi:MAG: hypothetical protein Q9187_007289, partial [Circinaria calcarea]
MFGKTLKEVDSKQEEENEQNPPVTPGTPLPPIRRDEDGFFTIPINNTIMPDVPTPTYNTPSPYRSPPTGHRSGVLYPLGPSQPAQGLLVPPQPVFGQLSRRRSASLRALDDPFVGNSTTQQLPVIRSPFHQLTRRYSPEGPLSTPSRCANGNLDFGAFDNDTSSQYSRSVGGRGSSVGDVSDAASIQRGPGRRATSSNMTGRGLMEGYEDEGAPTILHLNANIMARGGQQGTTAAFGDSSSANPIYTPQTSRQSRSGPSIYSSYADNLSDISLEELERHRTHLIEAGLLPGPPRPTPPPAQQPPVVPGEALRQWLDARNAVIALASARVEEPPVPLQLVARFPRRLGHGVVFWVSVVVCLLFPPAGLIIGYGYGDRIAKFCTGGRRSVGFTAKQRRLARGVGFGLTA